jgi:hypothetical protein
VNALEYEMEKRFTYHPPKGDQPFRYECLRAAARALAVEISKLCPSDTWETALALTKVEEAVMWANAAIAREKL